MSNDQLSTSTNLDEAKTPPVGGDPEKAAKYISQIIELIEKDLVEVIHTDLKKFDPSSMEDHFRLNLKDYNVEVSHAKDSNSGKDSYILLFTNLEHLKEDCDKRVILSYLRLGDDQFQKFKTASIDQLNRKKKEEEEKRFNEVMAPIDQVLNELSSSGQTNFKKTSIYDDLDQEANNNELTPATEVLGDSNSSVNSMHQNLEEKNIQTPIII